MESIPNHKNIERFDHKPTFAELWEMCVYKFLYNERAYCDELETVFAANGITKDSKILDVAAGGGFPSLELIKRGYNVESSDGFADEVALYNRRATERGLSSVAKQVLWKDLLSAYESNSYDLILCRGNSFVYALGGWNSDISIDPATALATYAETADIFKKLLRPGGLLYIDKFKDEEHSHRDQVAEITAPGEGKQKLIFWTERLPEQKIRNASMVREQEDGTILATPNVSYDLTFPELESSLRSAGFSTVETLALAEDTIFDARLARVKS
ncbi:MAG TPA: hypothetical protein VHC20_00525 [Candidatus Paceibacterota bacterium]|nr:hypothetical protein [Candidatus Paceibacterota bacterium]